VFHAPITARVALQDKEVVAHKVVLFVGLALIHASSLAQTSFCHSVSQDSSTAGNRTARSRDEYELHQKA
jgi:hypothetical protein